MWGGIKRNMSDRKKNYKKSKSSYMREARKQRMIENQYMKRADKEKDEYSKKKKFRDDYDYDDYD